MALTKYMIIGVLNTIIGYSVMFSLMLINIMPELSNFFSYAVGIIISYFLNKKYNFKSTRRHQKEFPKFLLSMLFGYSLNLLTLIILHRTYKVNPYLSQIIAGTIYIISGYTLSNKWVFHQKKSK